MCSWTSPSLGMFSFCKGEIEVESFTQQMGALPNRKPWEMFFFASVPSQSPVYEICSAIRDTHSCLVSFLPFIRWRCQFSWPWWAFIGLLIYRGHWSLLLATVILCACSVSFPTVHFKQPSNLTHPFVCFCKLPANCLISSLEPRVSDKSKCRHDFGPGQQRAVLSQETRWPAFASGSAFVVHT